MDRNVYSELYHMDRKDAASRQKVFILDFGSTATTIRVMKMVKKNRIILHYIIPLFNTHVLLLAISLPFDVFEIVLL